MIITFTNVIGAIRTAFSVVRSGLKMWLGFETSEVIGSEEVVNGDFATDSDWVKNNADISNGYFEMLTDGGSTASVTQSILTIGSRYILEFEILEYTSGLVGVSSAVSGTGFYPNSVGVFTLDFTAAQSTLSLVGTEYGFKIDNISVKEVTQFVKDKSPNKNNAKLFTGKALDFNGSTDSVDLGSQTTEGSELTVVTWLKLNDLVGNQSILSYGDFLVRTDDTDIMCFGDVAVSFARFSDVLTTNNIRLVVTISGTSASLYLNGTLIDTKSISALSSDASNSYIGKYTSIWFLGGLLADLQIYNKAWDSDDVAFDYNNPNHLAIDNPDTGLVVADLKGYWALSEGDGSVAYDSSGEGNNGTINGATYVPAQDTIPQLGMMDYSISTPVSNAITLVANPSNPSQDILGTSVRLREHAFNLDGSGYAEVADDVSLDFGTGTFSCDGWVKFKHVNTSSINCIYSNGGQIDSASNFGIGVTSNKIVARVSSTALSSSTTFSEGEWVYFALTRDGSGACKLYINDDTTPEGTASNAGSVSNPLDKQIGRDSSAVRFYQNLIDDVRVYNIELTSDEINNNYNVGLPAHSAGSSFSDDFSGDYGN